MTGERATIRQVVVLAGGLGTRLGSLSGTVPKAMQPIDGRPFLDVMLAPLIRSGHRRFHFCLGHLAANVARHLERQTPALNITTTVEDIPRGTAGALLGALDHLDETFLLVMGDTFIDVDHARALATLPDDAEALLLVTSAQGDVPRNVRLAGTRVAAYDKAGIADGWTDTGVSFIRRRALQAVSVAATGPLDLGVLFRRLIERRALFAETTAAPFADIGTPERYRDFERQLRRESARQAVAP